MARRDGPATCIANGTADPWIRIDGHALFRFATESFANLIRDTIAKNGWTLDEVRWIVPHQANGRILKAAAKRSGIDFEPLLPQHRARRQHLQRQHPAGHDRDRRPAFSPATSCSSAPSAPD